MITQNNNQTFNLCSEDTPTLSFQLIFNRYSCTQSCTLNVLGVAECLVTFVTQVGRSWPSSFSITPVKGDYGGCADGSVLSILNHLRCRGLGMLSPGDWVSRSWGQFSHLCMVLCYCPPYCAVTLLVKRSHSTSLFLDD